MGNTVSDKTHSISNVKNKKKKRNKDRKQKQKYSKTATEPSSSYSIESTTDKSAQSEDEKREFSYSHVSSKRFNYEIAHQTEELGLVFYKSPALENSSDSDDNTSDEYSSSSGEYSHSHAESDTVESMINQENVQIFCDYLETIMEKKMFFSKYQHSTDHKSPKFKEIFQAEIKKQLLKLNLKEKEMQQICKQFKVEYYPNSTNTTIKQISQAMQKK
eukprot:549740_1